MARTKDEAGELATADPTTPAERVARARDAMRERLAKDMLGTQEADSQEVMDRISENIMEAESIDDVLGDSGALGAEDLVGVEIELLGFRLSRSDLPGQEAFAIVDFMNRETRELGVFTTGAQAMLAQFLRADQLGAFPFVAVIEQRGRSYRLFKPNRETFDVEQ
jgi:hypothetical protein